MELKVGQVSYLVALKTVISHELICHLAEKENVPAAGPSFVQGQAAPEEADSESSQRSSIGESFSKINMILIVTVF